MCVVLCCVLCVCALCVRVFYHRLASPDRAMSSSGSPVKRERVLVLFKEFDEDQDGIITFDEFLAIVANEDATSG
jgi:hypothetical protein